MNKKGIAQMTSKRFRLGVNVLAFAGLMTASFFAGAAHTANTEAVAKLDQSVPFLVKARAILDSISTRQGVVNVQNAKASIDASLSEIAKAKTANGG